MNMIGLAFAMLGLFGCGRDVASATGATTPCSSTGTSQTQTYVLDFSQSVTGEALFGQGTNVAFTVDLTQPIRSFAFQMNQAQIVPGFSAGVLPNGYSTTGFDFGCPIDSKLEGVQKQGADLESGQEADVLSVDLDFRGAASGVVCFAYRAKGQWHYDAATFPGSGDQHTHVVIAKGLVDAIMLQESGQNGRIKKITYTVATP